MPMSGICRSRNDSRMPAGSVVMIEFASLVAILPYWKRWTTLFCMVDGEHSNGQSASVTALSPRRTRRHGRGRTGSHAGRPAGHADWCAVADPIPA